MSTESLSSSSSDPDFNDTSHVNRVLLGIGSSPQTCHMRNSSYFVNTLPIIHTLFKRRSNHRSNRRRYIARNREEGHVQLMKDYFNEDAIYTDEMFCRRFRMSKNLFTYIVRACERHSPYFVQRPDALGRLGLSSYQKVCAAIRMLAYGCSADLFDEYLKLAETTCIESLKYFCDTIIAVFEEKYLRKPNKEDIKRLLQEGEERGFPGMLGSLDCMHWQWKNCPTAWHGQYTSGYRKVPTLILEAVASKDLWIWHAFFGMAGSNNDINVLDRSPLFDDIINNEAPKCDYVVNGRNYDMGYYLSDNIYPQYSTLIQTISQPWRAKDKLFASHLEAARKDVERAFGVLQAKWHIVKSPGRLWDIIDMGKIMKTCIILHNMVVESQRGQPTIDVSTSTSNDILEENSLEHDNTFLIQLYTNNSKAISLNICG